ncbi:hypothetical protein LTR05_006526 [Lithohypha guttulata]|uniref:Uncharacterized protein n=1 Tax=Lithohypha guttulata TaxID=1690604 RepID=A0AAN7SWG4_9EURO|nr:hypothetical protein LTR05_006526 [Lithohypha guttulata]
MKNEQSETPLSDALRAMMPREFEQLEKSKDRTRQSRAQEPSLDVHASTETSSSTREITVSTKEINTSPPSSPTTSIYASSNQRFYDCLRPSTKSWADLYEEEEEDDNDQHGDSSASTLSDLTESIPSAPEPFEAHQHSAKCSPANCLTVEGVRDFAWNCNFSWHGHKHKRVHQLRGEWVEWPLSRSQNTYRQPGPSPLRQEVLHDEETDVYTF